MLKNFPILYFFFLRSEKGTIQVFDLGSNGSQTTRVAALTQQSIAKEAAKVAL